MDPANDSHYDFQTCVVENPPCKKGQYKIVTDICRIKPKPESSEVYRWKWDENSINDFHNGQLEWLPDDVGNNWLNLYTEFAYYAKLGKKKLPLEIKKVVVQTHEDVVEPSKKLKAENAIFYIIFNECGRTEDHKAVIWRTTDGIQGHVAFEIRIDF